MAASGSEAGGMPLVEEYFDREDERFVAALRQTVDATALARFADRWNNDSRPWARRQIAAYLSEPLNVPGHHPLVKRLFKQAESRQDHELMAAFLVAFDRLIRRVRKKRIGYEWIHETGQSLRYQTEVLASPQNCLRGQRPPKPVDSRGRSFEIAYWPGAFASNCRLFSYRTRHYLRRRAWRYFRRLARGKPAEYVPAVTAALLRYVDDDVAKPENLLDNWALMHVCFGRSEALEFKTSTAKVRQGHKLSELTAAPCFEPLWTAAEAQPDLLRLLRDAKSRAVRRWARQLLERHHAASLAALPVETLLALFDHDDAEVQQFAASLLERLPQVAVWPASHWLRLLGVRDPAALETVCSQFQRRVAPERLDLDQTLELALAAAAPVARLGLTYLSARKFETSAERRALVKLGAAQCSALGAELAKWALGVAGAAERYDREVVSALFDSLLPPMRQATCSWFEYSTAAQDDPALWSRLLETPFEDLRLRLVEQLERRAIRPRVGPRDLAPVWTSVLLGVHRGGRQKLAAVRQLAEAIASRPDEAPELMPVLAVAVRSIRRPEQRAGLAAVAHLLERQPALAEMVTKQLPELTFETTSLAGEGR